MELKEGTRKLMFLPIDGADHNSILPELLNMDSEHADFTFNFVKNLMARET